VESNGIPIPNNEKQAKLMTAFADELREHSYLSMGECMSLAGYLAERAVKEGWQWHPPKLDDFDLEHNKVALTPHQEIDIMDRIISGLPARVLTPANPDGVYVYDVASKYPKEFVSDWYRVPEYDNYEINSAGEIRNRWTRRVLEVAEQGGEQYVEMHDKEGFAHDINVRYVREKVFGE
jgi:hypothetical protein